MEHYGVRGDTLELFLSYLDKRQQFVEIDCYRSDVKMTPECGCVQGSKLSGVLYSIYTNEIPLQH